MINRSYKFIQWNKGNSHFNTKIDDLKFVIDQFSPDIISVCEANYDINFHTKIPGYKIEANRLHISNNIARSVLLFRDSITYCRHYDLENPYISSVWISININGIINYWSIHITENDKFHLILI